MHTATTKQRSKQAKPSNYKLLTLSAAPSARVQLPLPGREHRRFSAFTPYHCRAILNTVVGGQYEAELAKQW